MEGVTRVIERGVTAEMPACFGLIIYGWSVASELYIVGFAWYAVDGEGRCPLLCMAPLVNKEDSAASQPAFLGTMLVRDIGKRVEQCLFLVEDNCSVNRRLATLMGVPVVGCASPRLTPSCWREAECLRGHLRLGLGPYAEAAKAQAVCETSVFSIELLSLSTLKLYFATIAAIVLKRAFDQSFVIKRAGVSLTMSNGYELAQSLPSAASKRRLREPLSERKGLEFVPKLCKPPMLTC